MSKKEARMGKSSKMDVNYTRVVPAFLRPHKGLLEQTRGGFGAAQADEYAATILAQASSGRARAVGDGDEPEDTAGRDDEDEPGLQRRPTDKPKRALSLEELKARGNGHFAAGCYAEAIASFTECIKLDADNAVFYSNRSAAHAASKAWGAARTDAEACIRRDPHFAKGYSRLGAALLGAYLFPEAVSAYEMGLKLDAENAAMKEGLALARSRAEKEEQAGKHVFRSKKREAPMDNAEAKKVKGSVKVPLSFGLDDEDS